jgi:hypothetical protein
MRVTTQSASPIGDKDTIIGGSPNPAVVEGITETHFLF